MMAGRGCQVEGAGGARSIRVPKVCSLLPSSTVSHGMHVSAHSCMPSARYMPIPLATVELIEVETLGGCPRK